MSPETSPFDTRRLTIFTLIVFFIFSFLFVLLRSNDPLATDGPFRSLEVYRRQTLFFHGSSHMLYPVNVLIWTRLASAAGFRVSDPQAFYSVVVFMNCFAAAACLALFFLITTVASRSWRLAALVTVVYGLSKDFLTQATNAGELMVGLFWSFLAVAAAVLSIRQRSVLLVFSSGLFFALALTTYQSTVLLGPAALYLICRSRYPAIQSYVREPSAIVPVLIFGLGAVIGSASIYGWAFLYWKHQPTSTTYGLVAAKLFRTPDAHAFFGVSLDKLANIPVAFVSKVFPILNDFSGFRNLFRGPIAPTLGLVFLLLAIGILLSFCTIQVVRGWSSLTSALSGALVAGTLGLVFSLVPVVTFSQGHGKLWLQPLGCLFFLVGISLNWISRDLPWARIGDGKASWLESFARSFMHVLTVLVLTGVLLNLGPLVAGHRHAYPEMREAQRLANMIHPNDLVVGEWDGVSVLYSYTWASDGQFFSFTSDAASFGDAATSDLRNAILKTQQAGGRIFFLSVLDLPKASWDSFLGSRCGVSYSELDFYRQHSTVRATFQTRSQDVDLRQLVAPL
jgi:hypothetical protein